MKSRLLMFLIVLMLLLAPVSHGLMMYYGPDDGISVSGGWSEQLKEIVRTDTRVLGVVGPIVDTRIYCAGDTAKLNTFLKDYANVPDARLKVVIHPGRKSCTYRRPEFGPDGKPSGENEEVFDVDWMLHVRDFFEGVDDAATFEGKESLTTLDIWTGGQIGLRDLKVPAILPVASGGELERFVSLHEKQRKNERR